MSNAINFILGGIDHIATIENQYCSNGRYVDQYLIRSHRRSDLGDMQYERVGSVTLPRSTPKAKREALIIADFTAVPDSDYATEAA